VSANWELLQATNLSDQQLAELQASWANLDFIQSVVNALEMERASEQVTTAKLRGSDAELERYLYLTPKGRANMGLEPITAWDRVKMKPNFFVWRYWWSYPDELRQLKGSQVLIDTMRAAQTNGSFHEALENQSQRLDELGITKLDDELPPFFGGDPNFHSMLSEGVLSLSAVARRVMTAEVARRTMPLALWNAPACRAEAPRRRVLLRPAIARRRLALSLSTYLGNRLPIGSMLTISYASVPSRLAPLLLCSFAVKGRNCETNPISFKTYCPSNTNNEKFSLLTKSKSYDVRSASASRSQMLQVVAPMLLKMLHLKPIHFNDVADVAPFPTSYSNYATHPLPRPSPLQDEGGPVHRSFSEVGSRFTTFHVASQGIRVDWESARRIWRSRRSHGDRASGRERVNSSLLKAAQGKNYNHFLFFETGHTPWCLGI
jgi:hypothetical protein